MSFHTATIASATQPSVDLMEAIKVHIGNHAAWEFVEQVVSGANVTDVYKCLGSANGLGVDFFVGFRRTSATSAVQIFLGESYDTGTKNLSKFAPDANGTSVANQADGTLAGSVHVASLAYTGVGSGVTLNVTNTVTVNTSAFVYYLSVQSDCIIFASTVNFIPTYIGMYTNIHDPANQPAPHLIVTRVCPGTSSATASVTRDKPSTSVPHHGYCDAGTRYQYINPLYLPAAKDKISGNKWLTVPFAVGSTRDNQVSLRGYIPKTRLIWLTMSEFTEAFGDTVGVDGVTYRCFFNGSSNGSAWVSEAA